MYFLQQVINGISQGAIYALMAIGYTMIFGIVNLPSFCYGEVVLIGGFGAYYTFLFTDSFILGVLVGIISSGLLGIIIYKVCYERFLEAPRAISMICTFAFGILIKNLTQIVFGSEAKSVPEVLKNTTFYIKGLRITTYQILIIALVLTTVLVFSWFLQKTKSGLILRAISQNRKVSALMGINMKKWVLLGNSLGSALGGMAGSLLILYYTSVYPTLGTIVGNKALSSTVLGGLSSLSGSAIGGLLIGILENVGMMVISLGLRDVIAFIFVVLVLVFRPKGLFVKKERA